MIAGTADAAVTQWKYLRDKQLCNKQNHSKRTGKILLKKNRTTTTSITTQEHNTSAPKRDKAKRTQDGSEQISATNQVESKPQW